MVVCKRFELMDSGHSIMKINAYVMNDNHIGNEFKISTPISNAIQAGTYRFNGIQTGLANTLQLSKGKTYFYEKNIGGEHDIQFTDKNLGCTIEPELAYHTQSLGNEEHFFDSYKWIGCGPDYYDSGSEKWALDICRFNAKEMPIEINSINQKNAQFFINWQSGLDYCVAHDSRLNGHYDLTRLEFHIPSQYVLIVLFKGKRIINGKTSNVLAFAWYDIRKLTDLIQENNPISTYNVQDIKPESSYCLTKDDIQQIIKRLPTPLPLGQEMFSIQGLYMHRNKDGNMLYMSSQLSPKESSKEAYPDNPRFVFTWDVFDKGFENSTFNIYDFSKTTKMDKLYKITEFEGLSWDFNDNQALMLHVAYHEYNVTNDYPTAYNRMWPLYL